MSQGSCPGGWKTWKWCISAICWRGVWTSVTEKKKLFPHSCHSFLLFKPERPKCRWLISPAFLCPVTPSSFLFLHPLLLHRFCFIILCVSVCLKLIRGAALWSLLCRLIYCFIPYLQNDCCVCWLCVRTSADLYLQYIEQVTVLWVSLVYNDHPPLILPCMLTWTQEQWTQPQFDWSACLYVQFKVKALLLFQHCGIRTYSWWSCCSLMFKLLWHRLSHSPHKALYPSCLTRVVQSVHDPEDHLLSSHLWRHSCTFSDVCFHIF